jgi:hypothetical protein
MNLALSTLPPDTGLFEDDTIYMLSGDRKIKYFEFPTFVLQMTVPPPARPFIEAYIIRP